MNETVKSVLLVGSVAGATSVLVLSPGFVVLASDGHPVLAVVLAGLLFVVMGLPFGIGLALFAAYQRSRFLAMNLVPPHERLIHQDPANHFVGLESVGGWLYLTDRALRFKSHGLNIQSHDLVIPVGELSEAIPCRTAGIVPNGLRVTTKHGHSDRFVVSGRRKWSSVIAKAKMDAEGAGPVTIESDRLPKS